jgi:hypothetical protein
VAEGERTEDERDPEGQSPEGEGNDASKSGDRDGQSGGDSGGSGSSSGGSDGDNSEGFDEDAPGGASVPADGVGDWDPPHESEDESKFSETDAMGQDKRRTIIGQGYGPSRGRQFLYYGLFIAFLVAAFIGGKIAISELDKAPAHDTDQAPWTGTQVQPKAFE